MLVSDREKFRILCSFFLDDKNWTEKKIAQEIGLSPATVNNFMNDVDQKNKILYEQSTAPKITRKPRTIICNYFNLKDSVWNDIFYSQQEFFNNINGYIIMDDTLEKVLHKSKAIELSVTEENILKEIEPNKQDFPNEKYNLYSNEFLFQLAQIYVKKHSDPLKALEIINHIQNKDNDYKYINTYKIKHLEAICLSHDLVRKWDKAIDILRHLIGVQYYKQEREVLTLLASNCKRKALTDKNGKWCDKGDVDLDLLSSALTYYAHAYRMKKREKFYDGVNYIYLIKILDTLEYSDEDDKQTKEIFAAMSKYSCDETNWWELITKVESLMLEGKVNEANNLLKAGIEISDFNIFGIETTIRQLEMYIHFTDDENAKILLETLCEIKKYL